MPHKLADGQDREQQLRRLAVQIVGQLPASQDEANRVLEHAKDFVNLFLFERQQAATAARPELRCVKSD